MIQQILRAGKIKSISHEEGRGKTGEAHLAELNGRKYLLRICPNEETANKYLGFYNKFKKYRFFPKLLESEGKYLLFEFIQGRGCHEKEDPEIINEIGKICGIINKTKADYDYLEKGRFFMKTKAIIDKNILLEDKVSEINNTFNMLRKKVNLRVALEAGDVTSDNFVLDKKGKVYFVDIEAIKPNFKGYGIAKAFSQWFKTDKEREAFARGYNSVNSMKFYTDEYAKLTTLIFFVQRINFKFDKGEMPIVRKSIKKLDMLLKEVNGGC